MLFQHDNFSDDKNNTPANIHSCDTELIHYNGEIQPFGYFVLTDYSYKIVAISENLTQATSANLGQNLSDFTDIQELDEAIKQLSQISYNSDKKYKISGVKEELDLSIFKHNEYIGFDFQIISDYEKNCHISRICDFSSVDTLEQLEKMSVSILRDITGYDRVMLYKFDDEYNGEVVAEAVTRNDLGSYLGLHFPSGDIPKPARDVYKQIPHRVIMDIDSKPIKIISSLTNPVNLTHSILRANANVHNEYLKNMGVKATFTIPIVIDDRLWGLFAFHNYTNSKIVPIFIRKQTEALSALFKFQYQSLRNSELLATKIELTTAINKISESITSQSVKKSRFEMLALCLEEIRKLCDSDGIAVIEGDAIQTDGLVPDKILSLSIAAKLESMMTDGFVFVSNLKDITDKYNELSSVTSGAMSVVLNLESPIQIVWFRSELIRHIKWGGNPAKFEDENGQIRPRKSFETWMETRRHHSLPWNSSNIYAAKQCQKLHALLERLALKNEVETYNELLKQMNETLEEMVETKTAALVQKDKILTQQSKMAMMGEMMAAIAHQWRQPLSTASVYVQDIKLAFETSAIDEEYIKSYVSNMMTLIMSMSQTMKDFMNFFSNSRHAESFYIEEAIHEVVNILSAQLKYAQIETIYNIENYGSNICSYVKNELKQVLLCIIANAKDVLIERQTVKPIIKISVQNSSSNLIITIEDSAGGIADEILDKVFEPYFTTKGPDKGSGFGLFMSKEIIEEHMHGILSVENGELGALFKIILKN